MSPKDSSFYYSDGIEPVVRAVPEELFLVTIEARPNPQSEQYRKSGGAIVNCWVDADDLRAAERRAVSLMTEGGWRPYRFMEWELVTLAMYEGRDPPQDGPDPREVFLQTLTDGEVCVIHTWPVDAPDWVEQAESEM